MGHLGPGCGSLCLLAAFFFAQPSSLHAQSQPAARAYLYLEPNSARFECLVPLPRIITDLGLPADNSLSSEAQQHLCEAARQKAGGWFEMKIDETGAHSPGIFRTVVVKGVPGRTVAVMPGETLQAAEAMLGLVWEHDLAAVPEKIEYTWKRFGDVIPVLVTSVIAGAQSEEHTLTESQPSATWRNEGRLGMRSPLAFVPDLPRSSKIPLPIGSMLWIILGLLFFGRQLRKGRKVPGRLLMTLMSIVFGAAVLWPVALIRVTPWWDMSLSISADQGRRILTPLLRNVYRAFDQRQEGAIYDVLARSIEGPLLQKIYLQTIRALALDEQDATRARVTDLEVHVDAVSPGPSGVGFIADAQWTALGTVGHWGHQHNRVNRYSAKVTVNAVPQNTTSHGSSMVWKITGLDVEKEERM